MERLAARPPEVSASKEQYDHRLNLLGSVIISSLLVGAASSWLLVRGLVTPGLMVGLAPIAFLIAILIAVKFDFLVLVAFGLLSFVRVEPAPADILFAALMIGLLIKEKGRLTKIRSFTLIHAAVLVFIVTNFTAIGSLSDAEGAARYVLISVYLLAFFYFVRLYVTDGRALKTVVAGYLIAAGAAVLLGLLGLFNLGLSESQVLMSGHRWPGYFRLQVFFKDPNVFGPFVVPGILLLLEDLRRPWLLKVPRPVKIGILVFLMLGTILAFSRAAYLNLGVALVLYLILLAGTVRFRNLAVAAGLVGMVLFASVMIVNQRPDIFGLDLEKTKSEALSLHSYDSGRFSIQRTALEAALDNPFGIGPGQYSLKYKLGTHSLYLRVLAEQGWLGLVSFVGLIGVILTYLLRTVRSCTDPTRRSVAVVILACVGAVLANSFFIDTLHWRHFWLLLGLGWAIREKLALDQEQVRDDPVYP